MAFNFTTEIVHHESYISKDSKITGIISNPITWHLSIEINGKKEEFDLVIHKSGSSYDVSIKNTSIRATPQIVLHISGTDKEQAVKDVIRNWEQLYLEQNKRGF